MKLKTSEKKNRAFLFIGVIVLALLIGETLFPQGKENLPTGQVIDKVQCLDNPEQSYALYLPAHYTPDKKWPTLYLFDPGAQGKIPVELFKTAAEKYGYILLGSNNVQNGPFTPIFNGAKAMWTDSQKRFSIDEKRIYASGFSGGSRVASQFTFIIQHPVTGIIGIGAGLGEKMKPFLLKPVLYYGIVGIEDFNYREMNRLMDDFRTVGVVSRLQIYDGSHRWPPIELCTSAIEWMEIQAIKQGKKTKDDTLVNELFQKTINAAQKYENQHDLFYAVNTYETIVQAFDGLIDLTSTREHLDSLKTDKSYQKFLEKEGNRGKRELELIAIFSRVVATIHQSNETLRLEDFSREMKLVYLHKEANKPDEKADKFERSLARRLLFELRIHTLQEGDNLIKDKDYKRAALFYEIALKAGNEHPALYYNLACVYARAGKNKKALDYLENAVEKGFNNEEHIKKDADLDSLRNEKKYNEILKKLETAEKQKN